MDGQEAYLDKECANVMFDSLFKPGALWVCTGVKTSVLPGGAVFVTLASADGSLIGDMLAALVAGKGGLSTWGQC
jgi:hypothetical protein